ncbi:MAG TPA: hypothetical protein VGO62_00415, partial [Myxococcota bacterium]
MRGSIIISGVALGAALFASTPARAQLVDRQIFDAGVDNGLLDSVVVTMGDRLAFFANKDASLGADDFLWVSDGTAAATVPIAAVPGGALLHPVAACSTFVLVSSGDETFRSDGTEAGSLSLGVVAADSAVCVGAHMFFLAGDALFVTDGTVAGTAQLSDVNHTLTSAGNAGASCFDINAAQRCGLAALPNGVVLFPGTSDDEGAELWRTDGTDAGTALVADIIPGAAGLKPKSLFASGDRIFGTTDDGGLFVSDGSAAGTAVVASGGLTLAAASPALGGLIFGATIDQSLQAFFTDGTAITQITSFANVNALASFLPLGTDRGFFEIDAGSSNPANGMYVTDGTASGTEHFVIVDGCASECEAAGGTVFCGCGDAALGRVLLLGTDGTVTGTQFLNLTLGVHGMASIGGSLIYEAAQPTDLGIVSQQLRIALGSC